MNLGEENEKLEFKKSTSEIKEGLISLTAMLNKHGEGVLYFGVKNDGTLIGQKDITEKTAREISHKISEYIKPQIIPTISIEYYQDLRYIKVEVKGNNIPYSAYGKYYSRSFDEDIKLETSNLKELMNRYNEPDYIIERKAYNQDLTFNILKNMYIEHGYDINEEQFERNLGLLTFDGQYNLMAELLADKNDFGVRVATFAGNDKTVLIKRKEYGRKSLLLITQEILNYFDVINETKVKLGGAQRIEEDYFDSAVAREALLNAIVHNLWIEGISPLICIFDNRIEIDSNGALPNGLSKDDFYNGVSKPINPRLIKIFKDLDFIEETGHGVPLIVKKYGENAFYFGKHTIRVTIPINKNLLETSHLETIDFSNDLNDIEVRILELLKQNPKLTSSELMSELSVSERYIRRMQQNLKSKGFIERIGSNKSGYWKILK